VKYGLYMIWLKRCFIDNMIKKRCSKCGLEKEISEFGKYKNCKDGYQYYCRKCISNSATIYYQKHKKEIKEKIKKYYQEHKNEFKEYYQEHKEKIKEYQQKHKEEINKKRREYRQRPEVKERRKKYHQRPEVKERKKERGKEYRKKYKEKIKEHGKKYRQKHKKEIKERNKKYWRKHKKERREYCQKHKERIREREKKPEVRKRKCERLKKRYKEDLKFRLDSLMSKGIYNSVKSNKAGKHWETLVDFTFKDLKKQLEKRFNDKINWENIGTYWQIDHIIAKSLFKVTKPEDPEFKLCWALENLQPLEKGENNLKNNHLRLSDIDLLPCSYIEKVDRITKGRIFKNLINK